MKKIPVFLFAAAAAFFITACGKTELSFTNSSDKSVNDIVWAGDNASWTKSTGYAVASTTESKEVTETKGNVECAVNTGSDSTPDFKAATVNVNGTGSNSLSLIDGASNNYSLKATYNASASVQGTVK